MKVKDLKKILKRYDDNLDVHGFGGEEIVLYGRNRKGTALMLVPAPKNRVTVKSV